MIGTRTNTVLQWNTPNYIHVRNNYYIVDLYDVVNKQFVIKINYQTDISSTDSLNIMRESFDSSNQYYSNEVVDFNNLRDESPIWLKIILLDRFWSLSSFKNHNIKFKDKNLLYESNLFLEVEVNIHDGYENIFQ